MIPYAREAGAVVLLAALAGSHWYAYSSGSDKVQARFDAHVAQAEKDASDQREANRTRAVEVEERIVTQTVYRDRFITKTVKEIEYVAQPLAACPVPADLGRLLNDAARCAREDRSASCGADSAVPGAD